MISRVMRIDMLWQQIAMSFNPSYWPLLKASNDQEIISDSYLDRLPNDVLVIILSKVDLVTLCRCTAASRRFMDVLPKITSLSTPLPSSLFTPDNLKPWYGHVLSWIHLKIVTIPRYRGIYALRTKACDTALNLFKRVWLPKMSLSGMRFLQRLSGLEFLELELPTLTPLYPRKSDRSFWCRWSFNYDLMSKKIYHVYLTATVVTPQKNDLQNVDDDFDGVLNVNRDRFRSLVLQDLWATYRRIYFHEYIFRSLLNMDKNLTKLRTCLSKDTTSATDDLGRNDIKGLARLKTHANKVHHNKGDNPNKDKYCHWNRTYFTPSTLSLNDDSVRIKNVSLCFSFKGDIVGSNKMDDKLMVAEYLEHGLGDDDYFRKELREPISKILADDKTRLIGKLG